MPIALIPVLRHGANFTCHYQGVSHAQWLKNNDEYAPPQIGETSNVARPESRGFQNAQRSYEHYLALAKAQAQAGDIVGAENYYQHAEHYFRSMSSDPEAAPPVFGTRGADGKHDR
jgi:hypothetical protein